MKTSHFQKFLLMCSFWALTTVLCFGQAKRPESVTVGKTTMYKKDCTTRSNVTNCTICSDVKLTTNCKQYTRTKTGAYQLVVAASPKPSRLAKRPLKAKADPDDGGE